MFTDGRYHLNAIKQYTPNSILVGSKITEQYPNISEDVKSKYFVEIRDELVSDTGITSYKDPVLDQLNNEFKNLERNKRSNKFGVLLLGQNAPGGNNICDGLLKYSSQFKRTTLVGYVNGMDGVLKNKLLDISEESFAPFRNLGGYDYLGRSSESLEPEHF